MKRLALQALSGGLLLVACACASQTTDPPNIVVTYDTTRVKDCEYKGIVDYERDRLYSDVQEIREPALRMRVASVGGNTILVLPGSNAKAAAKAAAYFCPGLLPAVSQR